MSRFNMSFPRPVPKGQPSSMIMSSIGPTKPPPSALKQAANKTAGAIKAGAKFAAHDAKTAAMMPHKTAVGMAKNTVPAAKNLKADPKATVKSALGQLADTH